MKPRAVDTIPDDLPLDRYVPIATAALSLGCDESTVRKMLKNGDLEGIRVRADRDSRGHPRVSVASIERYKSRMAIVPAIAAQAARASRSRGTTNGHKAAIAFLATKGILPR